MTLSQKGITELNDALMEAMVLLDPPFLNRPSTLTSTNVTKAHDVLISTANGLDVDMNQSSFRDHFQDHSGEEDGTNDGNSMMIIVADLFRALILSSTLLLEMCPWKKDELETGGMETYGNAIDNSMKDESAMNMNSNSSSSTSDIYLSELDVERLYRTVRQSILLLQLLSRYAILSLSTISRSYGHGDNISDWHDELLPRSQYPLLQECFQRKELMDVEDNVVFGREDRLISLKVEDYTYDPEYDTGQYADGDEMESEIGETHNYAEGDGYVAGGDTHRDNTHEENTNGDIGAGFDDMVEVDTDIADRAISLSFDPKQLRTEEDVLLDVAFPETENASHNKYASKRPRNNKVDIAHQNTTTKRIPSPSIQHRLKQDGLLQFIYLPFHQACYIVKEGWLILRACETQEHSSTVQKDTTDLSCYVVLFSNGFICLYSSAVGYRPGMGLNSGLGTNENQLLHAFSISAKSLSKPTMMDVHKTFHFTIDQLQERRVKARNYGIGDRGACMASVVLGVDEGKGGGLTDGYNWMMAINQCSKETRDLEQFREATRQQWTS